MSQNVAKTTNFISKKTQNIPGFSVDLFIYKCYNVNMRYYYNNLDYKKKRYYQIENKKRKGVYNE